MKINKATTFVPTDPRRQFDRATQAPERQCDVRGRTTGDFNGGVRLVVCDHNVDECLANSKHVGVGHLRHDYSLPIQASGTDITLALVR